MRKMLIVDDEEKIRAVVREYAEFEEFEVTEARDGMEAVALCRENDYDIIIMDVMMPRLDGYSACKEIRKQKDVPIIMLSARGEEYDKLFGFETGIDDYVVKPFDAKEVIARIKAVLRRSAPAEEKKEGVYEFDNLRLDMSSYELRVKGKIVDAPPKELELLACLCSHPNRVYTRDQLLDEVWGFEYYGDSRTIDVHVKRLREKLEGASEQWQLKTVWGVGYKFEVTE